MMAKLLPQNCTAYEVLANSHVLGLLPALELSHMIVAHLLLGLIVIHLCHTMSQVVFTPVALAVAKVLRPVDLNLVNPATFSQVDRAPMEFIDGREGAAAAAARQSHCCDAGFVTAPLFRHLNA